MEEKIVDHKKDPVLVVVQLSGGNDFMNTVVPYYARADSTVTGRTDHRTLITDHRPLQ